MLEDVRNFVTVVQAGSFTRAADVLDTSRSVISKRLSDLEDLLGVRLLNRTTRRLSLTEAGERFYQQSHIGLTHIDDAMDEVRSLNREPRGRLYINLPMSFGILHVAPHIPEFRKRYPLIQVELSFEDRKVDVIEPGFDVSIRIGVLEDSSLVARKLASCPHWIVASPEYLKQQGTPQTPTDLTDNHTIASFRLQDSALEWEFTDSIGNASNVKLNAGIIANNSLAIKEIVLAGGAIARMPSFTVAQEVAEGQLINLFADLETITKSIYVVFPKREFMPAKTRAFIEFMGEKVGELF